MKEDICRAFCEEVIVQDVPAGLAVSTAFRRADGDAIVFYVVRNPARPGTARLEDGGQTIPSLEAAGVDLQTQTRVRAFETILAEHDVLFDQDEAVVHTCDMPEAELPRAALRFVALLLRLSDFLLLTQEHVESAFRDDAASRIREALGGRVEIAENEVVSPQLGDVKPGMILRAAGRCPVAVFFAQSAQKVNDAIFLQMAALYETREPLAVIALPEVETVVNRHLRQQAANRLAAVPIYRREEKQSIQRIIREALGTPSLMH